MVTGKGWWFQHMLRRYCFWGTVLVMSNMLIVGCASRDPARQSAKKENSTPPPRRKVAKDWPAEKLAQAHAHYAAAVIDELNEKPEAALQEYYQAALNDPENEPLILEVSRRFAQTKQPEKALELLTQSASRPSASGTIFAHLGFIYSQL